MENPHTGVYTKKRMRMWGFFVFIIGLSACGSATDPQNAGSSSAMPTASRPAITVGNIPVPKGYVRIQQPATSAAAKFLRSLTLKKDPTVYLFNGQKKRNQAAQYAVLDLDVGKQDLQQCADAVMRLRAEYLFEQKKFDAISFQFTNSFACDFSHYARGYRLKMNGNKCTWVKQKPESYSHATFRQYLDLVYSYAGTLSLHRQLKPIPLSDIAPGAVFIQTGNPYGHAVTVMDIAVNADKKDTLFLLSQSYMPAQDIHILVNPNDGKLSPWYSVKFGEKLQTPEWTFAKGDLRSF